VTEFLASCALPTRHGEFELHVFGDADGREQLVAAVHQPDGVFVPPLVRVHSVCLTGDVLGSRRCDCGSQLDAALRLIAEQDCGILLYMLGHEGRGIGLANKVKAYSLQEKGADTVDANLALGLPVDVRDYTPAVDALALLGVREIRLATNNPDKLRAFADGGIHVERIPLGGFVTPENLRYLQAKDERLGHLRCQGHGIAVTR
jgi:GTP cyclohydrolase II